MLKASEYVNKTIEVINDGMTDTDIFEIEIANNSNIPAAVYNKYLELLKNTIQSYDFKYNNGYLNNGNILFWKNKAQKYVKENFEFDILI